MKSSPTDPILAVGDPKSDPKSRSKICNALLLMLLPLLLLLLLVLFPLLLIFVADRCTMVHLTSVICLGTEEVI
jgi:hypothetical protein